jgi:hypothetical protein
MKPLFYFMLGLFYTIFWIASSLKLLAMTEEEGGNNREWYRYYYMNVCFRHCEPLKTAWQSILSTTKKYC